MEQPEEIRELADAKDKDERYFDRGIKNIKFFLWAIGGTYAIIAAGAVWTANVQSTLSQHTVELKEVHATATAAMDTIKLQDSANRLLFQGLQLQLSGNKSILDKLVPEHDEMWFMHQRGLDNSQVFKQDHGNRP